MHGLSELLLAGLAGAVLSTSLNLLDPSLLIPHRNPVRAFAVAGLFFAVGAILRALAYLSVTHGFERIGDYSFRTHYAFWTAAAAMGPLSARSLIKGVETGFLTVGIVMVTLLITVFTFTPAFIAFTTPPKDAVDVGVEAIKIRWAFPSLVGFMALVSLCSTVGHLVAMRPQGPRISKFLARVMALTYGANGVLVPIMAAADVGFVWVGLAPIIGILATVAWLACVEAIRRKASQESERSLRRLRANLERVSANALRDPLTGLFNRGFFFEGLHQAMEHLKREGEPFAVAMADIDDFKAVNDSYGHKVGDLVLQGVAKVLMRGLRPYDTAARFGGEEFVMILRGADRETALRVLERLRASIHDLEFPAGDNKTARVTATFGLAVVREPHYALDEVVEAVDRAMYEGKRSGKNQVRIA